jgi:hypothetical protein
MVIASSEEFLAGCYAYLSGPGIDISSVTMNAIRPMQPSGCLCQPIDLPSLSSASLKGKW